MHRSGTSCLAGSLQGAGLALGKHHTWNRFNQRGNRQNQDIVDFHEQLLTENQGSWDSPPGRVHWSPHHEQRALELVEGFPNDAVWGFKDPVSLLTLELWKKLFPKLRLVGVFRHPMAVASSLVRRSGGRQNIASGLLLWETYNRRLLTELRQSPFPLLCFDRDPACFRSALLKLRTTLGLEQAEGPEQFYDPALKHFDSVDFSAVSRSQEKLYRELEAMCS
jgi:hypothetical protein